MPLLLILLRKLKSGRLRLMNWIASAQLNLISLIVRTLTEKCWLLDYLPVRKSVGQQVLLVRLDLIGDFIIWLDSAKAYRQLYPTHKIVLFANSIWAELAKHFDYWDEVIPIDVPKLRTDDLFRLKQLVALRLRGFSVSIQPTYSREYVADLCVRASNAKTRLGHVGDLSNIASDKKAIADNWYTSLVDLEDQPLVELNLNASFVRALGLQTFQSAIPAINQRFDLPEHLKINEPYFVIVPGASWAPKMWPVENFAAVAKELSQLCGIKLVLCGTAAEISICQEIERLSGTTAINLAGQTALCDVVEVLNNAQLLIANDSAAIHIATATGTPSICILGGGHYGRFLPYAPERVDSTTVVPDVVSYQMDCYGCNWKCPYLADSRLPIPCVKLIGVDAIILACLRILEKRCGI